MTPSSTWTFLKPWANQCIFLMETFVLSYVNVLCIYPRFCLQGHFDLRLRTDLTIQYVILIYCSPNLCSVQFSRVQLFATSWTAAGQASLSITNSQSLLKLMSIEWVMPSNHLTLCRPLLLPPSIFPSIRVFSNESDRCIRWPKYGSFSFNISPSNEYSGLISFRIDWFHLLPVQGTLKSSPTPEFKSINSLALSFLYSPTLTSIHDYWKNHSLD